MKTHRRVVLSVALPSHSFLDLLFLLGFHLFLLACIELTVLGEESSSSSWVCGPM